MTNYLEIGGRSPEQEQEPQFDAVLVHGWCLSQNGEEAKVRGGLRAHFSELAAKILIDQKMAGCIVLTCGKIWGPQYPSVAQVMADELVTKYHVSNNHIIINDGDNALTTSEEIDSFLGLARQHGWKRLGDVGFKKHRRWAIPGIFKEKGDQVEIVSDKETSVIQASPKPTVRLMTVEDIIFENIKVDERIKKILRDLTSIKSKYEISFLIYELLKQLLLRAKGGRYESLSHTAASQRNSKGHLLPRPLGIILETDKYNLEKPRKRTDWKTILSWMAEEA